MQSRPQLLCLPPAGAGSSLYRPWTLRHRDILDIVPVSLPGREARITEPLPGSMDELADQLAEQLEHQLTGRYALFGYSMGAVLSYELVRRWANWGLPEPEIFFILGCNAPDRLMVDREPIHLMNPADFRQALLDIGGTPVEILDNAEAMALFEPVIRNDFRICETYQSHSGKFRMNCPAHAFVAADDCLVQTETSSPWAEFVTGDFQMHSLDGSHMLERAAFDSLLDGVVQLWPSLGYRPAPLRHAASG